MIAAALIVGSVVPLHSVLAQSPRSTDALTHRDLGDGLREVIQTRVDFAAGAVFPMHSHPGVEVAYVLEGSLQYQFGAVAPVTLKAGDSLFIPAGSIHSAKNVGNGNASEFAAYVVEMSKPLVVTAP
jgi:quercetin dioxygenase-like cupin family protein